MAENFPNFKKNYKPTDTRSSTNLKHRNMKKNITRHTAIKIIIIC